MMCLCLNWLSTCFHSLRSKDTLTVILLSVILPIYFYSRFWHFVWLLVGKAGDTYTARDADPKCVSRCCIMHVVYKFCVLWRSNKMLFLTKKYYYFMISSFWDFYFDYKLFIISVKVCHGFSRLGTFRTWHITVSLFQWCIWLLFCVK